MIVRVSAPGRAGILGNPSDMYGGSVIACALETRAWCQIETADTLTIEMAGQTCRIASSADLERKGDFLDLARVALKYALRASRASSPLSISSALPAYRLSAGTDIPVQAGLSGSTALLGAMLMAFALHENEQFNRWQLAETIGYVEYHEMGTLCGYQDAYMSCFGGLNFLDFRDKERLLHMPDEEPFATVEPLGSEVEELPMLVAISGQKHHSGKAHRPLRERWEEGEEMALDSMLTLGHLAREGKQALLCGDWETLGELMNENHAIVRELGGSGEINERLIKAAFEGGALSAKLAGAGHGGSILALTLDPEATLDALTRAGAELILPLSPRASGIEAKVHA